MEINLVETPVFLTLIRVLRCKRCGIEVYLQTKTEELHKQISAEVNL